MKKFLSLALATAIFVIMSNTSLAQGNFPDSDPQVGQYCKIYVDGRVQGTLSYERGYWKLYESGRVTATIAYERGYGKVYVDGRVRAAIEGDTNNCSLYVQTAGAVKVLGLI